MSDIKKILVIRLSSLGDIILSFPLLKNLKENYPEAELHFLTKEIYKDVILMNNSVDKILILKESLNDTRKEIAESDYDLIVDIHKNMKSIYVSAYNGRKIKRYRKDNFRKFLLVKFKIDLYKNVIPVYRKYLNTVSEYFDLDQNTFSVSELSFKKEKVIEGNYIVIAPSSRHFTKTYPKEKFVSYINNLREKSDVKFILAGDNSEKDKSICRYISENCEYVTDLCGKLSIDELAGVLFYSNEIITNDSSILHFSEALGRNVTAIFGCTVKQFGFFPQLKDSKVFEINGLKCRPCTHIGKDKCPEGHFNCMNEIELKVKS